MPLSAGTRLGPYEILAPLGAGGMGEVFRARDPRLGRDVAIKILPESFARDQSRVARFDREARLLASLNHANIAAIYGLEHVGGATALVLELVEGETLHDRIRRDGAIPVGEAISIARQLADALDAAHERGIVHRDLKPSNAVVTPDGVLKVLDFGLAKETGGDNPALTHSPTVIASSNGVLLGTAPYMSPEQARAKPVDKRTDIWAFGCVLYEMVTGRQAFPGETVSDHIAAILERDPDWTALPVSAPAGLVRLLRRCLEKDPRRRLRDIGDVRFELETATDSAAPGPPRAARWRLAAAASTVIALALGIGLMREMGSNRRGTTAIGTSIVATQLTNYGGAEATGTLSPDGRSFVFTSDHDGKPDMWLRQIAGGELIRLTSDDAEEIETVYSPDGESVFYSRIEGGASSIWRIGALGGQSRKVIPGGRMPSPSPDGRHLAYYVPTGSEMTLTISALDGSSTRVLLRNLPGGFLNVRPAWSPDGRWISYATSGLFAPKNLMLVDASTGEVRQVTHYTRALEGIGQHLWLPDSRHLVVAWSAAASQQAPNELGILDIDNGSLQRLTVAIGSSYTPTSLSRDGSRLLATASALNRELWKVPFGSDPDGNGRNATRVLDRAWNPLWPYVSRSGETVLFNSPINGSRNLWTGPSSFASRPRQITTTSGSVSHSSLSPDGERVAFASVASGASEIWVQNVDGSDLRQLTADGSAKSWPVWSPDGRRLVFTALHDGKNETWLLDLSTGRSDKLKDGFFRGDWMRRPDGGTSIVTTRESAGIAELIDGETHAVVWTNSQPSPGTGMPMFSPDGRVISVAARQSRDRDVIWVLDASTGAAKLAARLPFHVTFRANWIDNGTAFLVNKEQLESHIVLVDHVWTSTTRQ